MKVAWDMIIPTKKELTLDGILINWIDIWVVVDCEYIDGSIIKFLDNKGEIQPIENAYKINIDVKSKTINIIESETLNGRAFIYEYSYFTCNNDWIKIDEDKFKSVLFNNLTYFSLDVEFLGVYKYLDIDNPIQYKEAIEVVEVDKLKEYEQFCNKKNKQIVVDSTTIGSEI